MKKSIYYIGLDVHKETIAVSIAPQDSTEVRRYGIIGGTLDAMARLIKKLSQEGMELRFVYEAGPCGFVLCRYLRSKGFICIVVCPSLVPKRASDRVKTTGAMPINWRGCIGPAVDHRRRATAGAAS